MALTEDSVFGGVRVLPDGQIEVRTDNRVLRDGVVISLVPHRQVLAPGDDLAGQDPRVAAIAAADWTPDIVSAYQAKMAALAAERAAAIAAAAESDPPAS